MTEMDNVIDIVIPNIVEFNLRRIRTAPDPHSAVGFTAVGASLADESVFWLTGPRVQILHEGTDPGWWEDVHEWLGQAAPPLISPRGANLVDGLLTDADAMRALRRALDGYDLVRMRCWGADSAVYRLAAAIQGWGHEVSCDIPEPERYWTSLYLESKLSCADLAARLPGFRVPATFTVSGWAELQGAVRSLLATDRAAIVKAPDGLAGIGAVVARPGEPEAAFWREVSGEPLLRDFPVLVQEFIEHAPGIGCPAVDVLVEATGVTDVTSSALDVTGHRYTSVKVGPGALPASADSAVCTVGRTVGEEARRLGYRGWLGVDCVIDAAGTLYVTEINARRTGGMHLIATARRLGADRTVVRCESALAVPASRFDDVRPSLRALREAGVQIVATTARAMARDRHSIGIMTTGASPGETDEAAGRFVSTLG